MSAILKDALKNCEINFDRRVNVTDLVQDYELPYGDVNKILEEHLRKEESKGTKFLKRFLVQGLEKDSSSEVYTVVQSEKDMQEWLQRLEQSQTALYSVEIAGGAKAPAYAFKPVERHGITLQSLTVRDAKPKYRTSNLTNGNGSVSSLEKTEKKPLAKQSSEGLKNMFAKQTAAGANTSKTASTSEQFKNSVTDAAEKSSPVKKNISPKTEKISPKGKKSKAVAAVASDSKKGINNFFGASPKTVSIKQESIKEELKPKTTENVVAEKIEVSATTSKAASNNKEEESIQQSVVDSDEEIESSILEQPEIEKPDWRKRCRIIDSDSEDDSQPPQKVEKKNSPKKVGEEIMEVMDEDEDVQPKSETYLDEDGFVITIKSKKNRNAAKSVGNRSKKITSPRKTPVKEEGTKSLTSAKAPAAAAKTKQGSIMNFFSKK